MKTLLTTTALVALLAGAPVIAAETPITDQPTANDVIPDPALTPPAATPDSAAQPMDQPADPSMQSQDQMQTPAAPDTAAVTPAPVDKFLTVQADSEWLASKLIGSSVYNTADENLGDINDILVNDDGSVHAVIIGVGGFLGIGEKNVAISFEALEKSTDANGNVVLRLNASKEELDAAPAFVTVAEQQTAPTAEPAPVTEPAPAPMDTAPAPAPDAAPEPAPVQ